MDIIGKNIVVFTGAGISADSGISTFRDSDGMWENYNVYDVATKEGWHKNRDLVLNFYNERRREISNVEPNDAHKSIAELEKYANVKIITQNIDNLHEKAGSTDVMHLHGEIFKSRSTLDKNLIYDCEGDINNGDRCERNSQLRPHVVWFGEPVPNISSAGKVIKKADILIIVGSSLQVEPAASLLMKFCGKEIYLIDPNPEFSDYIKSESFNFVQKTAKEGVPELIDNLIYG